MNPSMTGQHQRQVRVVELRYRLVAKLSHTICKCSFRLFRRTLPYMQVPFSFRSKCTQTSLGSKCQDGPRHLRPGDNTLSALTSYMEDWRGDSDERVRRIDDFAGARGLALSTDAGW